MLALSEFRTYSRLPWLVRLLGELAALRTTVDTRTSLPLEVTRNELTELLPALTANTSLPSALAADLVPAYRGSDSLEAECNRAAV